MNYKKKYLKYKLKYLTLKKLLSRQHKMKGGNILSNCTEFACSWGQEALDKICETGSEALDKISETGSEAIERCAAVIGLDKKKEVILDKHIERVKQEISKSEQIMNEINEVSGGDEQKRKDFNEVCQKLKENADNFEKMKHFETKYNKELDDDKKCTEDACKSAKEYYLTHHKNMKNHMHRVPQIHSYKPCGISFEEHQKKQKIMRELLPKLEEEKANILENAKKNTDYVNTIEKIDAYGQQVAAGLTLFGIDGVDTAATVSSVLKIGLIGDITEDNINEASKNYIGELNTNFINKIDTFVKNNPKPTEDELNVLLEDLNKTEKEIVDKSRSMTGHKSGEAIKEGLVDVGKNAIQDVIMNKVLGKNLSKKVSNVIEKANLLNEIYN